MLLRVSQNDALMARVASARAFDEPLNNGLTY
jgi:hypothetical protein